MKNLVQFLNDRIDEDELAARACFDVNALARHSRGEPLPRWEIVDDGRTGTVESSGVPRIKGGWGRENRHIVRWDPARVLAECRAKRAMVEFLDPTDAPDGEGKFVAEQALRLVALPYADHPEYDESWSA